MSVILHITVAHSECHPCWEDQPAADASERTRSAAGQSRGVRCQPPQTVWGNCANTGQVRITDRKVSYYGTHTPHILWRWKSSRKGCPPAPDPIGLTDCVESLSHPRWAQDAPEALGIGMWEKVSQWIRRQTQDQKIQDLIFNTSYVLKCWVNIIFHIALGHPAHNKHLEHRSKVMSIATGCIGAPLHSHSLDMWTDLKHIPLCLPLILSKGWGICFFADRNGYFKDFNMPVPTRM